LTPTHDNFLGRLKRSREAFLDAHSDASDWQARMLSGTTYALWAAAHPLMAAHCRGLVLDAGSGRAAWRRIILETATAYESIDLAPRHDHVPTWVGDICEMPGVPDERYDTVVCHQVLEHVRRPAAALDQMHRVLKPGGVLVVSVPHLSRRHELPHDYFRYTQEGLASAMSDAGFAVEEIVAYGGLLAFVHHQVSMIVPGLVAGLPLLGPLLVTVNAPFSWIAVKLDELLDRARLLPTGIIGIGRRAER
jgi:SAM-dependent methyltransferase